MRTAASPWSRAWLSGAVIGVVGLRLLELQADRLSEVLDGAGPLTIARDVTLCAGYGVLAALLIRLAAAIGPRLGLGGATAMTLATVVIGGGPATLESLGVVRHALARTDRDALADRCEITGSAGTLRCSGLTPAMYARLPAGYAVPHDATSIDVVIYNRDDWASGAGLEVSFDVPYRQVPTGSAAPDRCTNAATSAVPVGDHQRVTYTYRGCD